MRRGKKRESSAGRGARWWQSQPRETAPCPGGARLPIGVPSQGQPFLAARPLGVRGVWLQQLPGLPALVPWAAEGVKRGEEKRRKKTERWERAAPSGAVCTGLDVSSACLFLLRKHFCQGESQTAEHTAHTHTHTHTRCFCRSHMHSPILKCFPVAPFLFHLLPSSPCVTNRTGTPPSSDGWWPCASLGESRSPAERQGCSPACLPPPCLSWQGWQPWASRMGANLVSQGHQPAVPLGPRPGNGHVLGFGCFPGLERKHPPPQDALCFPWTVPKCCLWGSEGPDPALRCTQSLSSHCAAKMPLILVLAVPRLRASMSPLRSHPASLGSELGTKGLTRAAGAGASRELLPLS